jgi:hypothetical protein
MTMTPNGGPVEPDPKPMMELIASAAAAPEFEADIEAMIKRTVETTDTPESVYYEVQLKLTRYLGDWDAGYLLLTILAFEWALDQWDPPLLDHISDKHTRQRVDTIVRRLGSIYGAELRGDTSDDWRQIDVSPQYDMATELWQVDVKLFKFAGQSFRLRSAPDSILRLVNRLMEKLVGIYQFEGTPPAYYDPEGVQEFLAIATGFDEALAAIEEKASADDS